MLANGATFSRDGIGIFPELVDEMFNSRKTFKKHANAVSREIEEIKNREDSEEKDCLLKQKQSEEATFEAKQMAYKISLNSLYGALANAYFRYNSHDSAEGITTTGQLVIRFISKKLNEKLNELFKTGNVDYVIFNDTDSIFPDGIIETSKGKMSIEDLWNNIDTSLIEISKDNYIKCPNNIKSLSYNGSHIEWNNIVALKKHKVKKRMYRITVGGKTIRVTEDHSLQVERNGDLIKIKPHEIKEGDLFIVKL
jgi:DNA polymerase elongation subunit (family B)